MGWLCLVAFMPLWRALGPVGFGLLLLGGLSFTLGALFLQSSNGIYPFDLAYFCPHRHDINVFFNSFIRLVPILQNDKLAGHLFFIIIVIY